MKRRYRSFTAYFLMMALLLQPLTVQAADVVEPAPTAETEAASASEMPGEPLETVSEPEQDAFSAEPENGLVQAVTDAGGTGGGSVTTDRWGYCGAPLVNGEPSENIEWEYDETTHTLTITGEGRMLNYSYSDAAPYPYVRNPSPWYKFNSSILHVKIDDRITYIGSEAFWHCGAQSMNCPFPIPKYVETISDDAFYGSNFKQTDLILPDTLKVVGSRAFVLCNGFENLVIPGSVERFDSVLGGSGIDDGDAGLKSITILPGSLKSIPIRFCSACPNLESVIIPSNIETIEDSAFYYCEKLESFTFAEGLKKIGSAAFSNCKNLKSFNPPSTLEEIGSSAFEGSGLTGNLTIPENIKELGGSAFMNCDGFKDKELVIKAPLKEIKGNVFNCCFFNKISLPDTIQTIGGAAFNYHRAKTLFIPELVGEIGENAFQQDLRNSDGWNLTDVYFPGNAPYVYVNSNYNTYGRIFGTKSTENKKINIHYRPGRAGWNDSNVIYTTYNLVETEDYPTTGLIITDCPEMEPESGKCGDHLTWTVTGSDKGHTLTITGSGDMYDYDWESYNGSTVPWKKYLGSIVKVVVPDGMTKIGAYSFAGLRAVSGDFPIPSGIKVIGDHAFSPDSNGGKDLNAKYASNFYSEDLSLPSSLTEIGTDAFNRCQGIKKVITSCPELKEACFAYCGSLSEIVLNSGVANIGKSAFDNCYGLTEITVPSTTTDIGEKAFYFCRSVSSLSLPKGLKNIGKSAFECERYDKSSYKGQLVLPEGLKTIGDRAFYWCTFEGDLILPEGLESIGQYAFYYLKCTGDLIIKKGLTEIPQYAFYSCQFSHIYLPDTLESIGASSFGNHSDYVVVPASVKTVGNNAFVAYNKDFSLYFYGAPPVTTGSAPFGTKNSTTLYYISGIEGWGDNLEGYECIGLDADRMPGNDPAETTVIPAVKVKLDKPSAGLDAGKSLELTATVIPCFATNKKVLWSSSKEDIATVNENGKVMGLKAGTTDITATNVDGGAVSSCSVTVTGSADIIHATSVSLNKHEEQIEVGKITYLYWTVYPTNATNKGISWSSDDESIATVISSTGQIRGVSAGSTYITVITDDGSKKDRCRLTVIGDDPGPAPEIHVSSVALSKHEEEVEVGKSIYLLHTVYPTNATNKGVTWSSDEESIATVNSSGQVKGVSAGSTYITVTTDDGSKTDRCRLTVIGGEPGPEPEIHVSSVELSKHEEEVEVGKSATLSCTIYPENAKNKKVTWSSDDESIAMVNSSGQVKGVSAGSVYITVTTVDGSKTDRCRLTVKNGTLPPGPTPPPAPSVVQYTLTFKVSDNVYRTLIVNAGETADEVEDPTGDGEFVGWYLDGKLWDRTLPVYGDATIVARFVKASENVDKPGESSLDTQPEIGQTTTSLKLVKGQKFTLSGNGWTSSEPGVVAVKGKNVTAKKAGSASLQIESQTINVTVAAPSFTDEDKKFTLIVPETKKLQLKDAGGFTIFWVSSAPDVASVASDGTVMAAGAGKAKITAYINGVGLVSNVTVKEADASKRNFADGGLIKLVPLQTIKISARGFKPKKAVWTSNRPGVSADSLKKGVVFEDGIVRITKDGKLTAIGTGQTTLTSSGAGSDLTFKVEVSEVSTRIVHMNKGTTKTLKMYGTKGTLPWTSSKEGIVKINKSNKIKGMQTGKTELTAEYDGFTIKVTVYVEEPRLANTELTGKYPRYSLVLSQGDTVILKPEKVYQPMVFKSSKNSIVFVNEAGVLTARAKGKAKLTAVVNKKTVTVTVTVK
ncbi:MAG: leucine-rich repeat protein [Lachnospiraceae bacterium]|nr:leucine-rich repeat protein [Lachnospiraceae bacterium]